MTLQIDGVRVAIFVIGCVAGYFVFKRSMNAHPGPSVQPGDLGAGLIVAATVIAALMALFGDIGGQSSAPEQHSSSTSQSPAPLSASADVRVADD